MSRLLFATPLVLAALARPSFAERRDGMCAALEPVRDGALYVSTRFTLPDLASEDIVPVVIADAFEASVRSTYKLSPTTKLWSIGCWINKVGADLEPSSPKLVRRRGNSYDGAMLRVDVSWKPDDTIATKMRDYRKREATERGELKAAGFDGYVFCVQAEGPYLGAAFHTVSQAMLRPPPRPGEKYQQFQTFVADKFQRALKGHAPTTDPTSNASCIYETTTDLIQRRRRAELIAGAAPELGVTYGEPSQRALSRSTGVAESSWILDDAGYVEFGAIAPSVQVRTTARIQLEAPPGEDPRVTAQRAKEAATRAADDAKRDADKLKRERDEAILRDQVKAKTKESQRKAARRQAEDARQRRDCLANKAACRSSGGTPGGGGAVRQ
jgi:hypothetical protein